MKVAKSKYKSKKNSKNSYFKIISIDELINSIEDLEYIKKYNRSRIEAAKKHWNRYKDDIRWIDLQNNERSHFHKADIEMPECYYDSDDDLKISDGRHRILAFKEMGYDAVECEIIGEGWNHGI